MTTVIIAVLAGLPLYAAFCLLRPTKPCRRCGGWGSKPGRQTRSARRHCSRCAGTGRRFRAGTRIIYRIRGARRRHAELALRATERAAAGRPRTGEQDRDPVRS